jgi:hypothetical protein
VLAGQDLDGRFAIVTGGYSGIGLESIRALAEAGATVIAAGRSAQSSRAAVSGLPKVTVEELDLIDPASIDSLHNVIWIPADRFISAEHGAATSVWCAARKQLQGMGGVYCENADIREEHNGDGIYRHSGWRMLLGNRS